jgi:hypothetical protein
VERQAAERHNGAGQQRWSAVERPAAARRTLPADLAAYPEHPDVTRRDSVLRDPLGKWSVVGEDPRGNPGETLCPRTSMVLTLLQTLAEDA